MSRTQISSTLVPSASVASQNIVNLLDNGGFEIWQRGTTNTTTWNPGNNSQTVYFLADRWQNVLYTNNGSSSITATVSQNSSTVHDGVYSLEFNFTSITGQCAFGLRQNVETDNYLSGQTITFSVWVNTTRTDIYPNIGDSVNGNTYGAAHPGDGQWHQLTVTHTVGANAIFCYPGLSGPNGGFLNTSAGAFYVDSAMLVLGSTISAFIPTHSATDLIRCQRYFEILTGANGSQCFGIVTQQTSYAAMTWPFKVIKRAAPTLTFSVSTVSVYFVGTVSVTSIQSVQGDLSIYGFVVQLASAQTTGNSVNLLGGNTVQASADI